MKSLWEESARLEIRDRLQHLGAEQKPLWGKMNAGQMVGHLAEAMKMTIGETQLRIKHTPLRWFPLKQLALYVLPFPKGAPTAPELVQKSECDLDAKRAEVFALLDAFSQKSQNEKWPVHPIFGVMTAKMWGDLAYKHCDHHLKQFGL